MLKRDPLSSLYAFISPKLSKHLLSQTLIQKVRESHISTATTQNSGLCSSYPTQLFSISFAIYTVLSFLFTFINFSLICIQYSFPINLPYSLDSYLYINQQFFYIQILIIKTIMSSNKTLHQQLLNELHSIFPDHDKGVLFSYLQTKNFNLDQTIDYILSQEPQPPRDQQDSPNNRSNKQEIQVSSPEVFTDKVDFAQDNDESDEERKSAEKQQRKAKEQQSSSTTTTVGGGSGALKQESNLSQEEQEKRSRELIDQLIALEMQAEMEQEQERQRRHQIMVAENRAIEQDIKNNANNLKKQNAQQSASQNQSQNNQRQSMQDQNPFKQQQQQPKKPDNKQSVAQKDESLSDQAEKTMSKMGAFFKNAFQKIEDSIAGSPPSVKSSNKNPYAKQEEIKAQSQKQIQHQEPQRQQQQPVKKQSEQFVYAHPSPIKRAKPDKVYDKEIIEEIIFHHPPFLVSSPQKLFKAEADKKVQQESDEEEDLDFQQPDSKRAFVNSSINLNKSQNNSDVISSNTMFGVNDQGEEIIGFSLPPQLQNQNGLRKRRGH